MLTFTKTTVNTGIPIFQKVLEVAQGGFTLSDAAFPAGSTVLAGTPIGFDETTRLAKVAKYAVAQANAANNATTYPVQKGHNIKAGSQIKTGASGAQAVTAIDTSNANYDVITVGTTLGVAVTTGDSIFVDDAGSQTVKGLLYSDVDVDSNGIVDIAVVLRGTVYARRIPPVPASVQAKLPLIIFSQSF